MIHTRILFNEKCLIQFLLSSITLNNYNSITSSIMKDPKDKDSKNKKHGSDADQSSNANGVSKNVTPKRLSNEKQGSSSQPASQNIALEAAHTPDDGHTHDDGHAHNAGDDSSGWKSHWPLLASLLILFAMLALEYGFSIKPPFPVDLIVYGAAYLLAGYNVLAMAFRKLKRLDIFNEFFLMSVATLGAFSIGSYSEGVAVMVFYSIGEWFQDAAVNRAKRSIKALLDIRPDQVSVVRDGQAVVVDPKQVGLGETIQVKPGEKVALDGELLSEQASFNTAALTGESKPDTKRTGEKVYAGMINLNTVSQVKVTSLFKDSKLSKILEMVQDATARKSQTQLFISRFAKIYTPIVFFLALALCSVPYFFVENYVFKDWLYRSLVFLVISCPCALVVSIPLGYFGGIGLASRNGILFKGSNYLDVMTQVTAIVMDKTGTLTQGVFKVQQVVAEKIDQKEFVKLVAAIESQSTHPIAKAIAEYATAEYAISEHAQNSEKQPFKEESLNKERIEKIEEISGHGLKGVINGKEMLAGNAKLLKKYDIPYPSQIDTIADTIVVVAMDGVYAGYITIADQVKSDAAQAIKDMHALGIQTVMLSGDKQTVVDSVAGKLGIDQAFGTCCRKERWKKCRR